MLITRLLFLTFGHSSPGWTLDRFYWPRFRALCTTFCAALFRHVSGLEAADWESTLWISRHAFFEFKLFLNFVSGEVMMRWLSTRRRWMSIPPSCRDSTLLAKRYPPAIDVYDALYMEAEITRLNRLESSRMSTSVQVRLFLVVMFGPYYSPCGKQ